MSAISHLPLQLASLLRKVGMFNSYFKFVEWLYFVQPSLFVLKEAVDVAKNCNEEEKVRRYAILAIEGFPQNSFGYLEYAQYLARNEGVERALDLLYHAPRLAMICFELWKMHGMTYSAERGYSFAYELQAAGGSPAWLNALAIRISESIHTDPDELENHFILAELETIRGNFSTAIELLEGIVDVRPKYAVQLSECLRSVGRTEDAYSVLRRAQMLSPMDASLLLALGRLLEDARKIQVAEIFLRTLLQVDYTTGSSELSSFQIRTCALA